MSYWLGTASNFVVNGLSFPYSDAEAKHGEVGSGHLNPLGLDYRRLSVSERGDGDKSECAVEEGGESVVRGDGDGESLLFDPFDRCLPAKE